MAKGKQKPKEERSPAELIVVLKSLRNELGNYLGEDAEDQIDKLVEALEEIEDGEDDEKEESEEE